VSCRFSSVVVVFGAFLHRWKRGTVDRGPWTVNFFSRAQLLHAAGQPASFQNEKWIHLSQPAQPATYSVPIHTAFSFWNTSRASSKAPTPPSLLNRRTPLIHSQWPVPTLFLSYIKQIPPPPVPSLLFFSFFFNSTARILIIKTGFTSPKTS